MNVPIRVMLVEDNELLGLMYIKKLEIEGCQVSHHLNGKSALKHIAEFSPDIIVTDIMMSEMDGLHTIEEVRKLPRFCSTKILTFSNLSNEKMIQKSFELGSDAYLLKSSTTPMELYSKIMEILNVSIIKEISPVEM